MNSKPTKKMMIFSLTEIQSQTTGQDITLQNLSLKSLQGITVNIFKKLGILLINNLFCINIQTSFKMNY